MANESTMAKLDASLLKETLTTDPRLLPAPTSPEVRTLEYHTDHMITVPWNVSSGWSAPSLQPFGPIPILPSASVLNYATECFEGLKLFRGQDGLLRLFRSIENCERMRNSAARVALPDFDAHELERLIVALCSREASKWLPKDSGEGSLYVRPTLYGMDPALATVRPRSALLVIFLVVFPKAIGSITGPEKPQKAVAAPPRRSMKLLASSIEQNRAWPGGFGNCKVGANYGTTLVLQDKIKAEGFDQTLWLFGDERYITEAGASNFFVVLRINEKKWQIVTAPLDGGMILPGITRACVLQLARERLQLAIGDDIQIEVMERQFTMADIFEANDQGNVIEAWVTGTALFVTPVGLIRSDGRDMEINCKPINGISCSALIRGWLIGIMNGREEHEWAQVISKA